MKIVESLNTQTSVETLDKQNSNYELFESEQLSETPFTIIKANGKYFGVLGKHRVTELFDTKEKVETELKDVNWNRILQVIWAVVAKFTKIDINDFKEK
jgi:hypothetical protein